MKNKKSLLIKILKIKGAGLLAFIIGIVLFSFIFNLNFLKPRIEAEATKALAQKVEIKGDIKLGMSWGGPGLNLYGVSVPGMGITTHKVFGSVPIAGNIVVFIDNFSINKKILGEYSLPIKLHDDGFEIRGLTGKLHKALLKGDVTLLDNKFNVDLDLKRLSYQEIAKELKGEAKASVKLKGSGKDFDHIMRNLNGSITVVGGEGSITSSALKFWTKDFVASLFSKTEEKIKLSCFVVDFDVKDSVAKHKVIVLDTDSALVFGEGYIDLNRKYLNILLKPKLKKASLVNLATPVQIHGNFNNVKVAMTKKSVMKGLGKMFLSTVNPAMLVVPALMDSMGGNKKSPCSQYLQKTKKVK